MRSICNFATNRRTALMAAVVWLIWASLSPAQTKDSCLDCHSNLPEPLGVNAESYTQNVHVRKGLTCVACHGGDANSDEPDKSMSRTAGFKGKITRRQIPELCASCHADAERMKKYNPGLRIDQFQQYKTSVHGMKWAKGDSKVAVCTDCHGVHDLRPPSDPRSKVHPTNIARTCAHCHADAEYMRPYGIKTDQFASYQKSVHHEAMSVRGDLTAPTCTTCHGNHGATPPGVANISTVCSNCHLFQAQLFATSPHNEVFAAAGLPGCVTCHGNHAIQHPTDALIGAAPGALCTNCHTSEDAGLTQAAVMLERLSNLASAIAGSEDLLRRAEEKGMEVSQPKLQATQARDALLKARVTIHTFRDGDLQRDTDAGLAVTRQTFAAGEKALAEWRFRRIGLGLSLAMIALTLVGLRLYITVLEKK